METSTIQAAHHKEPEDDQGPKNGSKYSQALHLLAKLAVQVTVL